MRIATITALLVGTLSAAPPAGGAADQASSSSSRTTTAVPTHALSGVVKSVEATTLVITRAGKSPSEMTFVLSPSTHRDGPIGVGATIQVRFRTEGRTRVATAILATPPKPRTDAKLPQGP